MRWFLFLPSWLALMGFLSLYVYLKHTARLRLKIAQLQSSLAVARALSVAQQKMATAAQANAAIVLQLKDECAAHEARYANLYRLYAALAGQPELDSGSAIPAEVVDPEQTGRLSHEESLQLAAQGDHVTGSDTSAIPVEIIDDASPTRRVSLAQSQPAMEPDCPLDCALPSEVEIMDDALATHLVSLEQSEPAIQLDSQLDGVQSSEAAAWFADKSYELRAS